MWIMWLAYMICSGKSFKCCLRRLCVGHCFFCVVGLVDQRVLTMAQYWIVSLPVKDGAVDSLKSSLSSSKLGDVIPFDTPSMAIGTLDSLMALTDDLVKINVQTESVLKKVERQYLDVVDSNADSLRVNEKSVQAYLDHFTWDSSRYKYTGVSMGDIVQQIQSIVAGVDDELKKMSTIYQDKQQNLTGAQRKKQVNLVTSDFEDFLTPQQVDEIGIIDSEFLQTLMVVVPKSLQEEFLNNYYTIGSDVAVYGNPDWTMKVDKVGTDDKQYGPLFKNERSLEKGSPICPATPKKICEEGEYVLFAISALRGHYEAGTIVNGELTQGKFVDYLDALTMAAREKRYTIRPLAYDATKAGGVDSGITIAENQVHSMKNSIIRWCRSHFGEVYSGYMHLKVIKTYAESILRYGVPSDAKPKYLTTFVHIDEKHEKQASDAILAYVNSMFPELSSSHEVDEEEDEAEYLPYVCHKFTVVGWKK